MLPTNITTTTCAHCAPFARQKFGDAHAYMAFEKELEAKCVDGTFVRIVSSDEIQNNSRETTYQCTFCETDWELSFPEGKLQGHFLPSHQTSSQNKNYFFDVKSEKRSSNCGCCLGMILLLIALIIYIIYSLFSFLFDLLF